MATVDFLPSKIRRRRIHKRQVHRQGVLLVVCVAVLAAFGYVRQGKIRSAQAELAMLDERGQVLDEQLAMRVSLRAELDDLKRKRQINDHLGSRFDAVDILGELQEVTPERIALTSLMLHATEMPKMASASSRGSRGGGIRRAGKGKAADGEGAPISRRMRLVVTGLAPSDIDVAGYIAQLATSLLFEDVNLGYTKTIEHERREAREFQISCFLER